MANVVEKIKVVIKDDQKEVKIPTGLRMIVRRCCVAVLQIERFNAPAMVSVAFVDRNKIRELNKTYRNKDNSTDVLSFPMLASEPGEDGTLEYNTDPKTGLKILGDIAISIDTALEQARRMGISLQEEVSFLVVHSMLHLLGYDHENSVEGEERMKERETLIMARLGYVSVMGHKSGI